MLLFSFVSVVVDAVSAGPWPAQGLIGLGGGLPAYRLVEFGHGVPRFLEVWFEIRCCHVARSRKLSQPGPVARHLCRCVFFETGFVRFHPVVSH